MSGLLPRRLRDRVTRVTHVVSTPERITHEQAYRLRAELRRNGIKAVIVSGASVQRVDGRPTP